MKSTALPQRKSKKRSFHLDHFLTQHSYIFFILFFAFTLWAFWTSFYGRLSNDMPMAIHFHGATMTLWCLLLISQPFLIRLKKNKWHRWMGTLSYILVPFILFSGAHLAHMTIRQQPVGSPSYYFAIALTFNSLIAFAIIYGLAIYHRKNSALHSRYMICTVFPLITPVTDRLIYKYFPSLIELAPTMPDGSPMVPALGFAFGDLILLILVIWDWRKHQRLSVFPFVLGLLLLYHISVLTFYKYPFWAKIGDVLMRLPLS